MNPNSLAAGFGDEGLSGQQACERLARDGPNELPRSKRRTPLRIAGEVVREPMLAMLLAAGFIYLVLGDTTEATILTLFACFSVGVTIVQEARTERVLDSLRDLSAPRALVIRDGVTVRIAGREVVQDDILVLEQGDRIAADALLLHASDFSVDESLLTGESVPVRKRAARSGDSDINAIGGDDQPQIFAGSVITRGNGIARVTATGQRSKMGQIGRSLVTLEPESPRLQRETAAIVRLCAIGGVAVALLVVLLSGLSGGGWLKAALAGIAVGMSLLPEEFPVVLTIFLAMGAWRIAQVGVLTRRASAIEAMGAATVLCTDKTGTLTQNRMSVAGLWLPSGNATELGAKTVDPAFRPLLEAAALASAPVPVDPMEVAFHAAARNTGATQRDGLKLVHSHGLRPDLLAMSNVWRSADEGGLLTVAAKGAPEAIAGLCELDGERRCSIERAARAMAERGMRVLGVASSEIDPADASKDHSAHRFTLLGLIGLSDPLRPGVAEAIAQCCEAGIRVVMVTGDYPATARAIAAQAGIPEGELMVGDEVAALSNDELAERIGKAAIFARTMPEQKLRIVTALKDAGEIVAMTGDGVNDAPALKAAHIGVAMGKRGTDVAREAAAIVLIEDDFSAIVSAIRVGRHVYDNLRKAMGFIFGAHVPIAGLAVLPLIAGLPVILGPIQIALLEMIIDPVCALVFEAEREERRLMQRPPRAPTERLFSVPVVAMGVVQGGIAFAALATLLIVSGASGMPELELRTFVFFALVAAIFALVLANRSFSQAMSHALFRHNVIFRYVLAFVVGGSALVLSVPAIRRSLSFAPLPWQEMAALPLITIGLLAAFELTKRLPFGFAQGHAVGLRPFATQRM